MQCGPVGGAVSDSVLEVLDAEGDPGERSRVVAGDDALVDAGGLMERPLAVDGHEGVVRGVQSLDPIQSGLGELACADLLRPHRACELGQRGGAEVDLGHVAVPLRSAGSAARIRDLPDPPPLHVAAASRRYQADGERPATASARSIPIGMTAGAGTVTPWST